VRSGFQIPVVGVELGDLDELRQLAEIVGILLEVRDAEDVATSALDAGGDVR
jgi:hypothetical protein